MHSPVRQSHSETVLSPEPVQMLFEYGWKQIELTESTWPRKVCLQRPVTASPQLGRVVHRRRDDKVAAVVVRDVPHGLRVVAHRVDAPAVGEVPNLDRRVAAARDEVRPRRREVGARQPVLVPLARHDEIARRQAPHLPRAIVRRRHDDRLGRVRRHRACDRRSVSASVEVTGFATPS